MIQHGSLQYVTITRSETAFSVNKVKQYMKKPLNTYWNVVKRILRYLKRTTHFGLKLSKSPNLNLISYFDSDYGNDLDDRRSVSGFCVFMSNNVVTWCSKKQ